MKKTICAGIFTLAMLALSPIVPAAAEELPNGGAAPAEHSIDIGHIHKALRLTPEQEPYWAPVESALRELARQQARNEPAGFLRRIGRRVVSVVLNSSAVERLVVAARPLIAVLNDEQKRTATGMAQDMGLGPVLAALN